MRLLPRSLFGRTVLVLAAGLLLAQIASLIVNLFDRGSAVYRLSAQQVALRIAHTARVLNRLPSAARAEIIDELAGTDLQVLMSSELLDISKGYVELDIYEAAFARAIRRSLGKPLETTVEITRLPRTRREREADAQPDASAFDLWLGRHFYFLQPEPYAVVAQVLLEDRAVAVFVARVPQEPLGRLESLAPRLALWMVIFFLLAVFVVRTVTRPLARLARAAEAIGTHPEGPPLAEEGPEETRSVIRAFNRMQTRVQATLLERAELLRAVSHDLKTPITRMRLRTEMLAEAAPREKFRRDLDEMASMVDSTLEFFRSLGDEPRREPLDVGALVESLAEDWRAMGSAVALRGAAQRPYLGHAEALRRCLDNLVGNAIRYGERARIAIEDDERCLRISVEDDGPGIPEDALERVFEPFYRLEASRNRASGGTGLGLSIARNIARWHGGELTLHNRPQHKGITARLSLPR
ncbi:MAG: ATP-binding protein [Burkholderiales bacterium]|nr:ATP-binding protein [Burkholderiales bacterium]